MYDIKWCNRLGVILVLLLSLILFTTCHSTVNEMLIQWRKSLLRWRWEQSMRHQIDEYSEELNGRERQWHDNSERWN